MARMLTTEKTFDLELFLANSAIHDAYKLVEYKLTLEQKLHFKTAILKEKLLKLELRQRGLLN